MATTLEQAAAVCTEVEVEEMAAYYGAPPQAKQTAAEEAQVVAADVICALTPPRPHSVAEQVQLLLGGRGLGTTEAQVQTPGLPILREPAEVEVAEAAQPEVKAEPVATLLEAAEVGVQESPRVAQAVMAGMAEP
jgi:hypothetical protein